MLTKNRVFKCGKFSFPLGSRKYVMGILNVTPDSFSDGGKWLKPYDAVKRAIYIQDSGADILDIGAQSTRPGYTKIDAKEEWNRLEPVLEGLRERIKIPISVDTFYPEVAKRCMEFGISIINDVTGFKNYDMIKVLSDSNCGAIVMHDESKDGIVDFFKKKISEFETNGISVERVCLDPGIGFGKTYEENLEIIANPEKFRVNERGLLIGASRKRVIGMSCGNPEFEKRLSGTICAHSVAMFAGADIIRVHDVYEAVQSARMIEKIMKFV